MSASRSRWCLPTTPISPRTPPIWSCSISRSCRRCSTPTAAAGRIRAGPAHRAGVIRKGYGDVDAAFRDAHAVVELELAVGRHSGVPLETRGAIARYDGARDVLEMHGAAKVPHSNREQLARMLGLPPIAAASLRGPCRRRLRHPRRALSRGRAGLRRGAAPRPAGQMDRGPARAPDRRQPFAPAASTASAPRSTRDGRILAHRRRILPRPGRLCAHACRHRARSHRRHAARPLSRAGLSRRRPHPADQQDAVRHLSRAGPLTRAPSCASG